MQRDPLLYGVIGAIIGGVVVWFLAANSYNNYGMRMMSQQNQTLPGNRHMMPNGQMMQNSQMGMDDGMTMADMTNNLKGKTGDEFDKAFIVEMIEHHQGAVDMANLAKQYAKHDEIKKMADDIITAQTKEIEMMK